MGIPQKWTFEQIGFPHKILYLTDYNAPFGRPRQKPVVRDGIAVRENTVYYPGSNEVTRHIFGIRYDDFELTGRWSDRSLGSVGAVKAKVEDWKRFVADAQSVQITWGDILDVTGFIVEFDPGREAEHEIAWRLKIRVDSDANAKKKRSAPIRPKGPLEAASGIQTMLKGLDSLLESIDNVTSSIAGAAGQLVQLASQVDNYEKAFVGQLRRLKSGIHQLKTATLNMLDTLQNAERSIYNNISDDIGRITSVPRALFTASRTKAEVDSTLALALMAAMDDDVDRAIRGKVKTTYQAQEGDSWESISSQLFGSTEKANSLRQMNGARYGQRPTPGKTLRVPANV